MADFSPEIASEIVSACQAKAEEAAGAFSRALETQFVLSIGQVSNLSVESLPDTWNAPGLVLTFRVGDAAALLVLPEVSGLLPAWYAEPNEVEQSRLMALAHDLGCLLLPESLAPNDTSAARFENMATAFGRSGLDGEVNYLALTLTCGDKSGEASLVWPLQVVDMAADSLEAGDSPPTREAGHAQQGADDSSETQPRIQYADLDDGIRQLPSYAKSLLKVRVPVTVTLASAKHPVSQILELGPGSIIQFNKSCEDNLTLEVGDHPIAEGEAVKVGDKFGLWLTSMTMPDERFWVVHGQRSGVRVK